MTNTRQQTRQTQQQVQDIVKSAIDMMVTNGWGHESLLELAKREEKLTK